MEKKIQLATCVNFNSSNRASADICSENMKDEKRKLNSDLLQVELAKATSVGNLGLAAIAAGLVFLGISTQFASTGLSVLGNIVISLSVLGGLTTIVGILLFIFSWCWFRWLGQRVGM